MSSSFSRAFYKHACDLASSIAVFFFVPLFLILFPFLSRCLTLCQGVMESFLGTALAGTVFCLFGGQPLIILSSTGPILIFEKLLFEFSKWESHLHQSNISHSLLFSTALIAHFHQPLKDPRKSSLFTDANKRLHSCSLVCTALEFMSLYCFFKLYFPQK